MLYAKIPDELGDYVAADGARFTIATATSAQRSPVDWLECPSLGAALEMWGLTPTAEPLE